MTFLFIVVLILSSFKKLLVCDLRKIMIFLKNTRRHKFEHSYGKYDFSVLNFTKQTTVLCRFYLFCKYSGLQDG